MTKVINKPLAKLLSRGDILAVKPAEEIVDVPEWGGSIRVLEMNGDRRMAWEEMLAAKAKEAEEAAKAEEGGAAPGKPDLYRHLLPLLIVSVVDANDQPLFTLADFEELRQKSPMTLLRIHNVAQRLSRLGLDQKAKAVKN